MMGADRIAEMMIGADRIAEVMMGADRIVELVRSISGEGSSTLENG